MARPLLVLVEHEGGKPAEAAFELLEAAHRLSDGANVVAVVAADSTPDFAENLPASEVVIVENANLGQPTADGYAAALIEAVREVDAETALLPDNALGWDVAPLLAAGLGVAVATGCSALRREGSGFLAARKAFLGKFEQDIRLEGRVAVATLERGAYPPRPPATPGAIRTLRPDLPEPRSRLLEIREDAGSGDVDLAGASVIVSAGRGLGSPENLHLVDELAEALGGAVGASRAITDAGWLPHERQIGSSGVTVSPKLYVACGISGAIQHLVGMRGAQFVLAINKDPEAPIFGAADLGIVGDVMEILPALTAAARTIHDG